MTLLRLTAALLLMWTLHGQIPNPPDSSIEGTVYNDITGHPLPRVRVVLSGMEKPQTIAATTDSNGRFRFSRLDPGSYTLAAEREGYLKATSVRDGGQVRQAIAIWTAGQQITGLTIRMRPGAIASGKVRYHDGDPAIGVKVTFFRQYVVRGRRGYVQAAAVATNDLGEYRAHALAPGTYYVLALMADSDPQSVVREEKPVEPEAVSTFYLSGSHLSEAAPVQLDAGQEAGGLDIVLARTRTQQIRGLALSGLTGAPLTGPNISLRWLDGSGAGSIIAPVRTRAGRGSFEISGVPPGTYLLTIDATEKGTKLSARETVTIGDAPIDELEIAAGPRTFWEGKIAFERNTDYPLSALRVRLEPRSETAEPVLADVDDSGLFAAALVPDERYDVFVENRPADSYLKSARAEGADVLASGFRVLPADGKQRMELTLSTGGGSVSGHVRTPEGADATGVMVVLVPQPLDGRLQAVGASMTDEYGNFIIRGVPPGTYTAAAWSINSYCAPYDPSPPVECQMAGRSVTIDRGDVGGVRLTMQQ